jgi:anti-anti-sigma factor
MANFHVLRLGGEIDLAQKQKIENDLSAIEGFGPDATVILDLSNVEYLDTTFLNALVRVRNGTGHAKRQGSIRLVAPRSNNIWQLFAITKQDRIFPLFDDMAAASQGAFNDGLTSRREGEAGASAPSATKLVMHAGLPA